MKFCGLCSHPLTDLDENVSVEGRIVNLSLTQWPYLPVRDLLKLAQLGLESRCRHVDLGQLLEVRAEVGSRPRVGGWLLFRLLILHQPIGHILVNLLLSLCLSYSSLSSLPICNVRGYFNLFADFIPSGLQVLVPQAQIHIPHHLVCEGHYAVFVRSFPDPGQIGAERDSNFQRPLIEEDLGENFIEALAF